jgi:hypothetical protein
MSFSSFLSLVRVLFLYEYIGQKLDSTVSATSTKGELIHWINLGRDTAGEGACRIWTSPPT